MNHDHSNSRFQTWAGRIISGFCALFLFFDGATKVIKLAPVMEVCAKMGFSASAAQAIGAVLLVCTVLYLIPQTRFLGAILLTGYLGGAIATHVHYGSPKFETAFPGAFGVLVWLGLYLRDHRLRQLAPICSAREPNSEAV